TRDPLPLCLPRTDAHDAACLLRLAFISRSSSNAIAERPSQPTASARSTNTAALVLENEPKKISSIATKLARQYAAQRPFLRAMKCRLSAASARALVTKTQRAPKACTMPLSVGAVGATAPGGKPLIGSVT